MWLHVAAHPTAEWITRRIARSLRTVEDSAYPIWFMIGTTSTGVYRRTRAMGVRGRPTAPRSPWQTAMPTTDGSVRRECLDNMIMLCERASVTVCWAQPQQTTRRPDTSDFGRKFTLTRSVAAGGGALPLPILADLHPIVLRPV